MELGDADKAKLRDAWRRALKSVVADVPVKYPDGSLILPRELMERRLTDPNYANSGYVAAKLLIKHGRVENIDNLIKEMDEHYKVF